MRFLPISEVVRLDLRGNLNELNFDANEKNGFWSIVITYACETDQK